VASTLPSASSNDHKAFSAGRAGPGALPSASSMSGFTSAVADLLGGLDHVGDLDQRQLLELAA
jgi:hypothetical protein